MDEDLPSYQRVKAVTWVAYDGDEPIVGSESDDPAMCMLFLMRYVPEEIGRDYVKWLEMRIERAETAVRALLDPAIANDLKEQYLDFVAKYIEVIGYFKVLYSTLSIRHDETEDIENAES